MGRSRLNGGGRDGMGAQGVYLSAQTLRTGDPGR